MATSNNGLSACANTCLSKQPFPICAKSDKQCRCDNGLSILDPMVQCVRATCDAVDQKAFGNGDVMREMYCEEKTATGTSSVLETIFVTTTAKMERGTTNVTSEAMPTSTEKKRVEEPTTMITSSTGYQATEPVGIATNSTTAIPSSTGSQATEPVGVATNSSTAIPSSTHAPSSSGLSKGTLIGISVAAPLILALIAFLLFLFLRRRRQQQNRHSKSAYDGSTVSSSNSHPSNPTTTARPVISNKIGQALNLKLALPGLITQEEHFKAEVRRSPPSLATFPCTTNPGTPVAELDCSLPPTTVTRAPDVALRNNQSVYYFRPELTLSTQSRTESEQRVKVNGQVTRPQMKEMRDEEVRERERHERSGSETLRPSMTGPLVGPWEMFPSIRGKNLEGMI